MMVTCLSKGLCQDWVTTPVPCLLLLVGLLEAPKDCQEKIKIEKEMKWLHAPEKRRTSGEDAVCVAPWRSE